MLVETWKAWQQVGLEVHSEVQWLVLCQTGAQTQGVVPTPGSRPFYILVLLSKGRASLSSPPDFVIQPWGKTSVGARPEIPAFRGP